MNKLLRVGEVAELLSCGQSTIWRWVKNGTFPGPVQINGISRWSRDQIDAVLQRKFANIETTTNEKSRPTRARKKIAKRLRRR